VDELNVVCNDEEVIYAKPAMPTPKHYAKPTYLIAWRVWLKGCAKMFKRGMGWGGDKGIR